MVPMTARDGVGSGISWYFDGGGDGDDDGRNQTEQRSLKSISVLARSSILTCNDNHLIRHGERLSIHVV